MRSLSKPGPGHPSTPSVSAMDAVTLRNSQLSPLLRLPAELRNRVYELLLGGHFIHVETEARKKECKQHAFDHYAWTELAGAAYVALSKPWWESCCLHYYLCKSSLSESRAYARSQDSTLDERSSDASETIANYWRMGDEFHIDPCLERHEQCYPPDDLRPEWMMTPDDKARRDHIPRAELADLLSLGFLPTCSQVNSEAKDFPMAKNTFGFRNVLALMLFLIRLGERSSSIKSLWLLWSIGYSIRTATSNRWNQWMSLLTLAVRLRGLRVLHVSISIFQFDWSDENPVRQDLHKSSLHRWVEGLDYLRQLPLEQVTVIVSDDPVSHFGSFGCFETQFTFSWGVGHERWVKSRQALCFSAAEKRQWANQLRSQLLVHSRPDSTACSEEVDNL